MDRGRVGIVVGVVCWCGAASAQGESVPQPGGWPVGFALLALLPLALILATCFIKFSVVLSFLRHALGAPQVPSTAIVLAVSVLLTGFVMAPVATEMARAAEPMIAEGAAAPSDRAGLEALVSKAGRVTAPLERWLIKHSGGAEVDSFVALGAALAEDDPSVAPARESFQVILPAFVFTELKEAFIIAFVIFMPFLVLDLVVSSVLVSAGMPMVNPQVISLPFKLLLFVMVDGWRLLVEGLVLGYV